MDSSQFSGRSTSNGQARLSGSGGRSSGGGSNNNSTPGPRAQLPNPPSKINGFVPSTNSSGLSSSPGKSLPISMDSGVASSVVEGVDFLSLLDDHDASAGGIITDTGES